jgi:hypothetical protein
MHTSQASIAIGVPGSGTLEKLIVYEMANAGIG